MDIIKYLYNSRARDKSLKKFSINFITHEVIKKVRNFHRSFSHYEITPLHSLDNLAKKIGVNKIWVKDESYRFDLNAFKVLGGSYAIGSFISKKLGKNISDISFEKLKSTEIKEKIGNLLFVSATDGNHGRGVAWAAKILGQVAIIFMPKGSSPFRVNNIRKEGAKVIVTDVNYDDTVKIAARHAEENNGILTQDTSWEGYEEIPIWIMQGYITLIDEIVEQLKAADEPLPTHIFLQAGVGSFAATIQAYLTLLYNNDRPITGIIEPKNAACFFKSINIGDGRPHSVKGDLSTMMAGLACGTPNLIAWKILRDFSDMFFSCHDYVSADGMKILGNPLPGDPQVISGESGAVGMGLLAAIFQNSKYQELRDTFRINETSRILLISTEGDTDPENYRKTVKEGKNPFS